ncbi:hypothetical protein NADE_007288 [Nannochloris sp. 'desiccata']|nr:hypothetical protein NADE_007288 [Chlorella desiccata (nom. nud.)]
MRSDGLADTPAEFNFRAADNVDNEAVKKQIEEILSQMSKMPASGEIEGCHEKGRTVAQRYSKFMAEQLGIGISLQTPELIGKVKDYVKDLNDHVRFLDSGDISAKANNRRQPQALARFIDQAPAMGLQQQQQQGATDNATAVVADAQDGLDMETAGAGGDATLATAAAVGVALAPPRRESQLPAPFRDSNTLLLGANAGARIRNNAAAAVQATKFKLEQLFNQQGTDIGSRFPSLRALLPQIENQCDLVAQLCLILYNELEAAMEELRQIEVMVQALNRAAPQVVEASKSLIFQLDKYTAILGNALEIGGDIQVVATGAPDTIDWDSDFAAEGAHPDGNPAEEELQPTTVGCVRQLQGMDYLGGIAVIHRFYITVTGAAGILGITAGKGSNAEVSLPLGSYFLLSELFNFFGAGVDIKEPPFSTWNKWRNRKSALGKVCYSVEAAALEAKLDGGEQKFRTGNGGKVLLLSAHALKVFFNTSVVKHFQNPQQVGNADIEEGLLQQQGAGGGGAGIEDQEVGEDEFEDMQTEIMNNGLHRLQRAHDPVFNSSTGCLAWALEDVVVAIEDEAASDLEQENDDGMDGLNIADQATNSDSDIESPESSQLDSSGVEDE